MQMFSFQQEKWNDFICMISKASGNFTDLLQPRFLAMEPQNYPNYKLRDTTHKLMFLFFIRTFKIGQVEKDAGRTIIEDGLINP